MYSRDVKTIADEFNEFFSTVGAREAEASASLAVTHDLPTVTSSMIKIPLNQRNFIFKQSLKMKSKGLLCPFNPTRRCGSVYLGAVVLSVCEV